MSRSFKGRLHDQNPRARRQAGPSDQAQASGGSEATSRALCDMIADLPQGAVLLADKGYDAHALRETVAERGATANIPPEANRRDPVCFSKHLYKARNCVERFCNKIKHYHRIATRYDKTTKNFPAALNFA